MRINKKVLIMAIALSVFCVGCGSKGSKAKVKLGDYEKVEVEVLKVEPTEEEIQNEIDSYLEQHKVKDAENTVVDDGETVNIDYTGTLDGVAFEGGTDEGFDLVIGSGTFLDGFESGLIGKSVGETVTLDITFPEVYDNNPDLAGKATQFSVVINYIYSLPELTDEYLQGVGDYDSIDTFKKEITKSLTESKQTESDNKKTNSVMLKIIKDSKFSGIQDSDTKKYYDEEYNYYESVADSYYNTDLETFLGWYQITLDEFKQECKDTALLKFKEDLVLDAIAKKEKIKITNTEYKNQINEWLDEYSSYYDVDEATLVEMYGGEEQCKKSVLRLKVRERVVKDAVVTASVDELTSDNEDIAGDSILSEDKSEETDEDEED